MKGKFDYFKYQRYNKKRKKPWRSLKWFKPYGEGQTMGLRKRLLLLIILEGAAFSLSYGGTIGDNVHGFLFAGQEEQEEKEVISEAFWGRKTGETREEGLSVDWKAGTVKLWKKMERVILLGPD